jgi:hypothetical protein
MGRRIVGGTLAAGLAVAAVWIAACSDPQADTRSGSSNADPGSVLGPSEPNAVGQVSLDLNLGPGVSLTSFSYLITGPNTYSETITIGDAQSLEFIVGGIAAGAGYTLSITGQDSAGDPCSGATTTPFTIVAGAVTQTTLAVTCVAPPDASITAANVNMGSLEVDASVLVVGPPPVVCPGITSFTISPAELASGQSATLSLLDTDPTALITWSVSPAGGGVFGSANAPTASTANTTFTCTDSSPQVTVTATIVSASDAAAALCSGQPFQTISAFVNCEPQCTAASNCPAATTACKLPVCTGGLCGFTNAALGTACTDSGGSICDGAGTCVVPSFDVVRLGNGSAVTAGTTVPVFIDRYSITGGPPLTSTALPTAVSGSNQPLTVVGSDVTEGDLTTSVDGRWLVMAGHNYAPGSTIGAANCGVAFIGSGTTPTVNTSVQLPLALAAGGIVRSAASLDGTQVWVVGAATTTTGGLWYMPGDVQVVKTTTTTTGRDVRIAGGQLFADSNANPPGLFKVGSGEPITGTPAPTLAELPGLPTSGGSPYSFVFLTVNGVQTLYVADDEGGGVGGILKFTLSGATWTSAGHVLGVSPDGGATVGYRGLAGYVTGTTVTLMASSGMAAGGQDELVVIVDTGTGTPTQTPIETSPVNETFRGIAVPPHP